MEIISHTTHDIPMAGLQSMTTIDFPGKTAAVLFTQGCSWNCGYCHNPLCRLTDSSPVLSWEYIESFLQERIGFLDGIVISGGEPTIHSSLPHLLEWIRELGYSTALHTNGCNNKMLQRLLKRKLVDYVAMDVKGPPALYDRVTGVTNTGIKAARSISVILSNGIDYEFRTTYHPRLLSEQDLMDTVHAVYNTGARRYFIQRFRRQGVLNEELAQDGDVLNVPESVVCEARKLFDDFDVR